MQNIKLLFLALFLVFPVKSFSKSEVLKEDFAFGQEIILQDVKSVVQIQLPETFYSVSKNANLSDLAIFNAAGEPVPHTLLNFEKKQFEKFTPPQSLPIFPIYENVDTPNALRNIKISTNSAGTVVDISEIPKLKSKNPIQGYLVDASKISDRIDLFQFNFKSLQKNMFYKIKIEGSNDLKNWSVVVPQAVMAWFEMNGQSITQNTVDHNGMNFKFYKISNSDLDIMPSLNEIVVNFATEIEHQNSQTFFRTVSGKKTETEKNEFSYIYDLAGNYPVLGLKLKFKDNNSMALIDVQAANSEKGPWMPISRGHFLTVNKNGKNFEILNLDFVKSKFQFWKLILLSNPSGIGQTFPEVTFTWQPHRLLFLARGEAPFLLAYGSSKVVTTSDADFTTFSESDIALGELKSQISLGGQAQLVVDNSTPINYRKYVLWATLILGVFVIGFMALQVKKNA